MKKVTFEEVYANAYVRESIQVLIQKNIGQYPMLAPYRMEMEQEMLIRLNAALDNFDPSHGGASVETFARSVLEFAVKDFRKLQFSQKAINRRCSLNFMDVSTEVDGVSDNSAALLELRMDIKSVMSLLSPIRQEICRKLMDGYSVLRISSELKIPRHDIRRKHIPAIRKVFRREKFWKYLEN